MKDERITIILPKELVKKLTALAKGRGLSRAAFIRMTLFERARDEQPPKS